MITVQYFASVREAVGRDSETLELPAGVDTVDALIDHLVGLHGEKWREILRDGDVLVAVDQSMARKSAGLNGNEEVAFFPAVTGG